MTSMSPALGPAPHYPKKGTATARTGVDSPYRTQSDQSLQSARDIVLHRVISPPPVWRSSAQQGLASPVLCQGCWTACKLTCTFCPVCEEQPQLCIGSWSFAKERALYDSKQGPELANSTVFFGRAKRLDSATVGAASVRAAYAERARELLVAAKSVRVDGDQSAVEMARREITVFKAMGSMHPNLLPLLFGGESEEELVVLSPYCPAGDLHKLTFISTSCYKCLEEADASCLASQLLSGIAALHSIQFLHGDVKPHNVFLTEVNKAYVVQIGDFGLSRWVPQGEEGVESLGGTSGYMAPEMVGHMFGHPPPIVSFAVDLFAIGVIVYQLLSSMSPFHPPSNVKAKLEFDGMCWGPLAPEAQDFVSKLLAKSPAQRGTAEEALAHPWLEAGACAPRGQARPALAPQPDTDLHFLSVPRAQKLFRRGKDDNSSWFRQTSASTEATDGSPPSRPLPGQPLGEVVFNPPSRV